MAETAGSLGEWLEQRCQEQGLSLRQAASKTGLSHATIRDIVNGNRASAESIKKLAQAFAPDGYMERLTLEDILLVLAGYRTPRPEGEEITEPMARIMDRMRQFNEKQLKIMGHFADFLSQIGT